MLAKASQPADVHMFPGPSNTHTSKAGPVTGNMQSHQQALKTAAQLQPSRQSAPSRQNQAPQDSMVQSHQPALKMAAQLQPGQLTSMLRLAPGSHSATVPSALTTTHLKSVTPGGRGTVRDHSSPSVHSITAATGNCWSSPSLSGLLTSTSSLRLAIDGRQAGRYKALAGLEAPDANEEAEQLVERRQSYAAASTQPAGSTQQEGNWAPADQPLCHRLALAALPPEHERSIQVPATVLVALGRLVDAMAQSMRQLASQKGMQQAAPD